MDDPTWMVPSLTVPPREEQKISADTDADIFATQQFEKRWQLSSLPQLLGACGTALGVVALLMLVRPAIQCWRRVPARGSAQRSLALAQDDPLHPGFDFVDEVEEIEESIEADQDSS